jgi:hypothetical protein
MAFAESDTRSASSLAGWGVSEPQIIEEAGKQQLALLKLVAMQTSFHYSDTEWHRGPEHSISGLPTMP